MIFETHGHYDDSRFDEDREQLIKQFEEAGIDKIVNIGSDIKSSQNSVELAEKYDSFYAAVGVHPSDIGELSEAGLAALEKMAVSCKKVVAIGEIGLDYYYEDNPEEREAQKMWFVRQLELAKKLGLPVVIHSRDSASDTMEILKKPEFANIGGVIHCYSYSLPQALEYVKMGFNIGVGGVVTFTNGKKLREVVDKLPLEKIVLETDSPYLSPVPVRGKRNSALNIPYIANAIAEIKGVDVETVYRVTYENAKKMYRV
jgi:TatD DNase family protein